MPLFPSQFFSLHSKNQTQPLPLPLLLLSPLLLPPSPPAYNSPSSSSFKFLFFLFLASSLPGLPHFIFFVALSLCIPFSIVFLSLSVSICVCISVYLCMWVCIVYVLCIYTQILLSVIYLPLFSNIQFYLLTVLPQLFLTASAFFSSLSWKINNHNYYSHRQT